MGQRVHLCSHEVVVNLINDRHEAQTLDAMRRVRKERKEKLENRLRGIRE